MSPSSQVHIPVVFDNPVISSIPKDSFHSPPLQVYNHHQTFHCPFDDSLLVSALSPPPTPIVEPALPIVIRKDIRSTHNPYPHYTALS